MKEISILHIMNDIEKANGSMSVVMNYYAQIYNKNIKFYFLFMKDSLAQDYKIEIESYGGKCRKICNPKNGFMKFRKELSEFCKEEYGRFDIVHIHLSYLASYCFGIKKKLGAKKIIYHAHSTQFSNTKMKSIRNCMLSIPTLINGDVLFACSKDAGKALFGKRFDEKGIVIRNAINTEKFKKFDKSLLREELGLENKYVVGHIGTFNEGKNHKFIIDVFNELIKIQSNAVLVLVGDGELRHDIENRVKQYGLTENVIFMGIRSDIPEILNVFDKLIFPSYFEGVPMVMLEAQACGVPCVYSTTITSDVNILKGLNVQLSLNDGAKQWANSLLNGKQNESLNQEEFKLSGYDIKYESEKLLQIYRKIANDEVV